MLKCVVAIMTLSVIAGCAKAPESIQASYISDVPYRSWSCNDLVTEQARLASAYNIAAQQQAKARSNDIAGVIFLGVPVSSMSGDNIAHEVARLKGEQEAVRKVIQSKKCEGNTYKKI